MSNKGMKLSPRSPGICRHCKREFVKNRARETYCSIECALWSKIDKRMTDACWPWRGGLVGGYGAGTFRGKRYRASRKILAAKLGHDLPEGVQALHSCDNPHCCNPDHLFAGTNADNQADKKAKGRGAGISPKLRGSAHGRALLSEADVSNIWRARSYISQKELADRYGVAKSVISKIMKQKTWSWLTSEIEKRLATEATRR
jgi:hypothetical protein